MRRFAFPVAASLLLSLAACQKNPIREAEKARETGKAETGPARGNLLSEEAAFRAAVLSKVSYKLHVSLEEAGGQRFGALAEVSFELSEVPSRELFLDFRSGAHIRSFEVNGREIAAPAYAKGRLSLPPETLQKGPNTVSVAFDRTYSKEGAGLYRFQDPEDKRVYLYTQFEAFDANHMFPCFDQPDLRARMKMSVTAPEGWKVITATRESSIKPVAPGRETWNFPETPPISSYLFSLHAGPYHVFQSKAGALPLRLFVRQSLKPFVNAERDWFVPTRQGLKFYGDYFAYSYPFKKYDQVIVPDFNAGAMENVAAVTFSERFVDRGGMTREARADLADVILHEMAHMWFGNLVTMRWWNGLWLNESFASYMSVVASVRATEFKDGWQGFYQGMKGWAYWEDQLVTTHPIEGPVADTNSSMTVFDGITYGKGASVLKQLAFYLGDEKFRDGLRIYFREHAFKNTSLGDFIGALEKGSKRDLGAWSKLWLERAGLDAVQAGYECRNGKISSFELRLTPPKDDPQTFRPHRSRVALYRLEGARLTRYAAQEVEYSSAHTPVPGLVGRECPALAYPNDGDFDYAKVRLDAESLKTARSGLTKVQDPFLRSMLWANLFEMVRDGELSPADYLETVAASLPGEKNLKILDSVVNTLHGWGGAGYGTPAYYMNDAAARARAHTQVEALLWKRLAHAKKDSDEEKAFFDAFVKSARTTEGASRLAEILARGRLASGWELDQDRRWSVAIRLSSLAHPAARSLLEAENARDASERGQQSALSAEIARPQAAVKEEALTRILPEKGLNFARTKAILRHLLPSWQEDLKARLADRFYSDLERLASTADHEFLGEYAESLAPTLCTQKSVDRLRGFVVAMGDRLPPTVRKALRVAAQEDERCVNVRAKGRP